ncbi:ExeM/NucH family extracellular endonuclease [Jannaschia sp. S6380]|uniref:ExeM/NucH family extracellular endonuclease n=1 Tax=Jannaschia sp. S6380 TaxID=2926408 RepID=UPI001FF1BF63|nr:ExeM/NucH family extracellular endonuclease [Jannaschia sp. S6380]MCK0168576.1 ExeM/NucH family extracellular endonuclease [Jannaschia sp. S6380]
MALFRNIRFGTFHDDLLTGTRGRDLLFGLWGDDTITAGGGNDIVFAGWGDDILRGGAGRDRLYGGRGDDTLEGGAGRDRLDGGRGTDTAIYAGGVADYAVIQGRGDRFKVENLNDAGDVDSLRGIERLYFAADDYTADLTGGNNAVLARDDTADVSADAPLVLDGLTENDFDFDGDALSITGLDTAGLTGMATLNADGTVSYDAQGAFDALAEGETAQTSFLYTVADGRGGSDTARVTVTVTGANDAPVIDVATSFTVAENGVEVGRATATDVDGDAVTFSLDGADAARFSIAPDGTLRFDEAPDFETPGDADGDNVYDVTVVATDAGGLSDARDVQVTVTDEDETPAGPALRINEFHYDNAGADVGEFIEVAGTAGTDISGWTLVLYNGSNGTPYRTVALSGSLSGEDGTGYASVDVAGLQNGSPDGIALVAPDGTVAEFLSYEGSLTAVGGPADGLTSTDIGVAEGSDTAIGQSLQLQEDGTWAGPQEATRDGANDGSGGGGGNPPVAETLSLNEFHYDNAGSDEGEFIEVAGDAGAGLEGWSIALYNGNGGVVYRTIPLSGSLSDDGFASVDATGLQNGPDAIALVTPDGTVAEFIAYEGDVTATDGPAAGMTATDIGVAEGSDTAVGQSLQKQADGSWAGPADATRDAANDDGGPVDPGESEAVLISTIQGSGESSTLVDRFVNVTAVVTATLSNGFYLQEEDADADGDAATSEGIFVFTGGAPTVTPGEIVFAEGIVGEAFGQTQLTPSTITGVGNGDLPTAANLTLPFTLEADLESVEGMRVSVTSADDAAPLTVIENFNFDRFGEIVVSAGEQIQPTQIFDAQTQADEIDALQAQNAANRLRIDDGSSSQNPTSFAYIANDTAGDDGDGILSAGDDFALGNPAPRIGAEMDGPIEGVLGFGFGSYRLFPTETLPIDPATNDGARDAEAPEVGGDLKVVSFNALNYFTTLGERGADSAFDLARQTEKLVNAMVELDGDVVGLQEIENNGFGDDSAIATLVAALNDRLGAEVYDFVDPTEDGGPIGTDAIATGLIYKTEAVGVTGSGFLEFDDGGQQRNRPAVAATFEDEDGGTVTIAVNHFKSKGPSGLDAGDASNPDSDQGDGQGFWNATRTDAANQLTAWLAGDPFDSGDPDYLIIGDLNAYSQEDPVQAIEEAGYANLLEQFVGAENAYSFVFNGQQGALDHAMASNSLAGQVTGVAEWHINANEPDLMGYSSEFTDPGFYNGDDPFAASDHDPLIVGLTLTTPQEDGFVFA